MAEEILLQMKNITKIFPGVKALDQVSLTLRGGTVHALIGRERRWQVQLDEVPVRAL